MARVSRYEDHKIALLRQIDEAARAHRKPPTLRAIGVELGVSVSTVFEYLKRLRQEGLVEWQPKSHRTLRLTRLGFQELSQPVAPSPSPSSSPASPSPRADTARV